jgi:hypothetical protein
MMTLSKFKLLLEPCPECGLQLIEDEALRGKIIRSREDGSAVDITGATFVLPSPCQTCETPLLVSIHKPKGHPDKAGVL